MSDLRIHTPRLELLAVTRELLAAEIGPRDRFSALLGAEVPSAWPPPLNDEASLHWMMDYVTSHPEAGGWTMWYFMLKKSEKDIILIGNGGFKGLPTAEGTVEVGYSLVEAFHGNGYATETVRALAAWAFSHGEVRRVIAETFPHLRPSIRVLEKCGFAYIGEGSEMLTIRYELTREEFGRLNPIG